MGDATLRAALTAPRVVIASAVTLLLISLWGAAAIVLSDLAYSAHRSMLANMLFSYGMNAVCQAADAASVHA